MLFRCFGGQDEEARTRSGEGRPVKLRNTDQSSLMALTLALPPLTVDQDGAELNSKSTTRKNLAEGQRMPLEPLIKVTQWVLIQW